MKNNARKITRQRAEKRFVEEYYIENHVPPTVREILRGAEVKSTATVHADLEELVSNGTLSKQRGMVMPNFSNPEFVKRIVESFTSLII